MQSDFLVEERNLEVINAETVERIDWQLMAYLHQTERGFEKQQVH